MCGNEVVTFGCRLNSYESEVIRGNLSAAAIENSIVFNTCSVTKEAERQAKQAIRKAKRDNPESKIIVTGCAAQIDPESYSVMEEVDFVVGNQEKLERRTYLDLAVQNSPKTLVNDIMAVRETASHMVENFSDKVRAFVQVQNGCDHRCTFCIIPYGRGNSRSVAVGGVVSQVAQLVKNGCKEVVFTGVDISDYGKDLPGKPTLGQMVRRVLALVPELERLRLSSIDVAEIDEDLICLIKDEPRLMPHLHISLQAGDDMILKRMKRRHNRQQVIDFCNEMREKRPEVAFGADIIAGFPTETEEMFLNTLNLVEEADLQFLHVFPYSVREGTPAAKMPQVPKEVRKQRAARLREKGEESLQKFLMKNINLPRKAIVEKEKFARGEDFVGIELTAPAKVGAIVDVDVFGVSGSNYLGRVNV